ncbi:hypothetical protein [Halorussus litoreus]|uniref:hypothetical protein n=1 Tax=Halorussus litoreus TaxID=1710536 RepID=UPI000E24A842|nr:hypothetical protein [Halorussus litoreus]
MTERRAVELDGSTDESGGPAVEWRHDARDSRALRVLAHGFVAALGGPLVLLGGVLLLALPDSLSGADPRILALIALLALVGGPFSLLYLWPMLVEAEQRPSPGPFGADRLPWTVRSTAAATLAGAALFGGLTLAGIPGDALFGLAVALLFSPVLVNLFSTVGRIEGDRLVCNGQEVALAHVSDVRSVRVDEVVVCWLSYARGTGLLVPRFLTVSPEAADAVLAALERGVENASPESRKPDRAVRVVVCGAGLLFVGVGVVAVQAVDDPVIGAYFGGVLGLVGAVLCVVGWRGV